MTAGVPRVENPGSRTRARFGKGELVHNPRAFEVYFVLGKVGAV